MRGVYKIEVTRRDEQSNYLVYRGGVFWFSSPSKEEVHSVLGRWDARRTPRQDDNERDICGIYIASRPFVANIAR